MNDLVNDLQPFLSGLPELVITYTVKVLLAIAVYIIGKWIVGKIVNVFEKTILSRGVDPTVATFVKNISYYVMLMVVVIAALGQLGIKTASFVAIIGAAGLAVGLALQGSLSNFAAGVMLILFRPFRKGDFVEAAGIAGVVHEISIFNTIFKTGDNKTVIVSNSDVTGSSITNYSTEATRRVDITVGVGYSADIKLTKDTLQEIADAESRILADKGVTIAVAELADCSVNLVFRVWVNTPDYWGVKFDLTEKIKLTLDEKGIEIPFPQMDISVKNIEQLKAS